MVKVKVLEICDLLKLSQEGEKKIPLDSQLESTSLTVKYVYLLSY